MYGSSRSGAIAKVITLLTAIDLVVDIAPSFVWAGAQSEGPIKAPLNLRFIQYALQASRSLSSPSGQMEQWLGYVPPDGSGHTRFRNLDDSQGSAAWSGQSGQRLVVAAPSRTSKPSSACLQKSWTSLKVGLPT